MNDRQYVSIRHGGGPLDPQGPFEELHVVACLVPRGERMFSSSRMLSLFDLAWPGPRIPSRPINLDIVCDPWARRIIRE